MNSKKNRGQLAVALLLTAGVGVSCIPAAAATMDNGKFAIHALNDGNSEISSVFGTTSIEGGGTVTPPVDDGSAAIIKGAAYKIATTGTKITGGSAALRIDESGQVWSWGADSAALGHGNTTFKSTPTKVPGLEAVEAVSMGSAHGLALTKDGTVKAWGANTSGQVGNGSKTGSALPVTDVAGLTDVISVTAAGFGSYAVTKTGDVYYWGSSAAGTNISATSPTKIEGLTNIKAVGVSYSGALNDGSAIYALNKDGEILVIGESKVGLLGLGDGVTTSPTPTKIDGLPKIKQIANSTKGALALGTDGSVWNWGTSMSKGGNSFAPVRVELPGKAIQVANGVYNEAVVLEDGSAYAWGNNIYGQLGAGLAKESYSTPQKVNLPEAVNAVAVGSGNIYFTTPASGVYSTGDASGLGRARQALATWDTTKPVEAVAAASSELGGFAEIDISTGGHVLAKTKSGDLYSWGSPGTGYQLGFGAWGSPAPRKLNEFTDVQNFDTRSDQSWVVNGDGKLFGWGRLAFWGSTSADGATGSAQTVNVPTYVGAFATNFKKWIGLEGLNIKKVSTVGNTNTAFLTADGKIYSRSDFRTNLPYKFQLQETPGGHVWKDVVAVGGNSIGYAAIKDDGTVWTFNNKSDKYGSVTTTPVQLSGLSNIVSISDTNDEIYALDASGKVFQATATTVKEVTGLPKIKAVKGAMTSGMALDESGNLWVWGGNANGQLGTGNKTTVSTPKKIDGLSNIVNFDITAGTTNGTSAAVDSAGRVYIWGSTAPKIVGDGIPNAATPYKVNF